MRSIADRVQELEDWVTGVSRNFDLKEAQTGRWTAEGNSKMLFGKTILELANEQLRSDSDHWAQKAHVYRDQVATFAAENKELKKRNERQSDELQRYIRNKIKLNEELGELQRKFDVLSENCRHLRVGETRVQLEDQEKHIAKQDKLMAEKCNEIEAQRSINHNLSLQVKTLIEHNSKHRADIADQKRNIDKYSKANQRQAVVYGEKNVEISGLKTEIEAQNRVIKKQSDTIQIHLKHLDHADGVIEDQIKTIKDMRLATVTPMSEVHVLVYKYRRHLQFQVAGVFTSRDLMLDWIRENPKASEEDIEMFTYTLNEGEL